MNDMLFNINEVVRAFNSALCKESNELKVVDYTRLLLSEHFNGAVDKQKVDDMIKVCTADGITISGDLLYDFGAITKQSDSNEILYMIKTNKLIKDVDWIVKKDQVKTKPRNLYYFRAHAFMLLINRSKYTREYADACIFVFCCSQIYYNDYQTKLELHKRDNEIRELQAIMQQLNVNVSDLLQTAR